MYKRIIKKRKKHLKNIYSYPKVKLSWLIVALLCSFLIVIATFSQFSLAILTIPEEGFLNPASFFSSVKSIDKISKIYYYIPQVPVVIFVGALLGPRIGLLSVGIYVLAGLLGLPVFASGGGIEYYKQLGFGYILGYFAGAYLTGNILSKSMDMPTVLRATLVGVLSIHLIGILYLIFFMIINQSSLFSMFGWVWALSAMQLPYDIAFAFFAIYLSKVVRSFLWLTID